MKTISWCLLSYVPDIPLAGDYLFPSSSLSTSSSFYRPPIILLSYYPIILLSYYPIILLLSYHPITILLSSYNPITILYHPIIPSPYYHPPIILIPSDAFVLITCVYLCSLLTISTIADCHHYSHLHVNKC